MVDTTIIDELFDIYMNDPYSDALEKFSKYYIDHELYGKKDLIKTLKEFVKTQSKDLSNYFSSNKDENKNAHKVVSEVVAGFESLITPINYLIAEYEMKDLMFKTKREIDDITNYYQTTGEHVEIKPHHLFNMDLKFIDEAYKKCDLINVESYEKVKGIITYVKNNRLLDKLYSAGIKWENINFEELIYMIYDKVEDKSIFDGIDAVLPEENNSLFQNIKLNCGKVAAINFEKYRPYLSCKKQMHSDYGKLIFCKNLLMFYQTGIMPNNIGLIDCRISESEIIGLLDDFNSIYNKRFDSNEFKTLQGNYIFEPEFYNINNKIEIAKKVVFNKKVVLGFLITSNDSYYSKKIPYLLHMEIADIESENSNYEIQLSVVPEGQISERIQLIRLDNWESEQPHKNIAKKLTTTTHIHLYNQFDLLRGKKNGGFDIMYNLKGDSTPFEVSLKTFLNIIGIDKEIKNKIYNITTKTLEASRENLKTIEI